MVRLSIFAWRTVATVVPWLGVMEENRYAQNGSFRDEVKLVLGLHRHRVGTSDGA